MTNVVRPVVVRRDERARPPEGQTPGMTREQAFATPSAWAGLVTTDPGLLSGWHHHGEHDTYVYVLSGVVRLEFGTGGNDVLEGGAEDFVHIPKGLVHREGNPGSEPARAVVIRSGSGAPVVNVDGPEA